MCIYIYIYIKLNHFAETNTALQINYITKGKEIMSLMIKLVRTSKNIT